LVSETLDVTKVLEVIASRVVFPGALIGILLLGFSQPRY